MIAESGLGGLVCRRIGSRSKSARLRGFRPAAAGSFHRDIVSTEDDGNRASSGRRAAGKTKNVEYAGFIDPAMEPLIAALLQHACCSYARREKQVAPGTGEICRRARSICRPNVEKRSAGTEVATAPRCPRLVWCVATRRAPFVAQAFAHEAGVRLSWTKRSTPLAAEARRARRSAGARNSVPGSPS